MAIIPITQENFDQEVTQATLPVIIDIYATWCGPCQQMMPIVEELEKELKSKYKFVKLNVDESRDLAVQYGVTSVPTFILIKNGKVQSKITGYIHKDALKEKIEATFG